MSNNVGSSTVDQRIVEMRIDNEKFEAGAKKTINILESLDRSLKGVGQGNAEGFDSIGQSLDKVTDRFSAMGIVGDQVMRNLTNQALGLVSQLKNVATMLTTQQIGAGWSKYADKTQAIQTIMAATSGKIDDGTFADQAEQLEWVNEQIEKLNKFTDETSYNFLDMVGNIGKFTAAGRELGESVTAMEGIATWAAISGGRPVEASRAMYNLSQALGLGAVTIQDWKSIEMANMATMEFKQQVIDTAVAMGQLRQVSDGVWETTEQAAAKAGDAGKAGVQVTAETLRDSLRYRWFDSDVLLNVLNDYGAFSDELLNVTENLDVTATEYLKWLKCYKDNKGDLNRLKQEFSLTDEEIKALIPSLEKLSQEQYDLGFRAFQAAQEAKTFQEAIDATKDAVSTKWMTVFELLFGNYLEAKELWTQMSETFWDIFAQPVDRLIDIIKGARGLVTEEGIFPGMVESSASVNVLNDRLSKVGKTMEDFKKAIYSVSDRKTIDAIENFSTIEDALMGGAISADLFKKALGAMDDEYGEAKMVGLDRALNKAGKTMDDFKKAVYSLSDRQMIDNIENYDSIKDAFRNGAISVDIFKKALESLGIDSEHVTTTVEGNVESATAKAAYSLEEMRNFALEVLRGDHGNGAERRAWYESMGLDAELMQAMAGDLMWGGYNMTDEKLMDWMERYYNFNNLKDRLGYNTFAEYLASLQSAVEDNVYGMEDMAEEAEDIYASLFGEGILSEIGEFRTAGDLFRESLSNLLTALDNIGTAFDKAFLKVFGGGNNYDSQVAKMSDGFFTLSAAFWSFSNRVLAFTESEGFLNFATAVISALRIIGKILSFVFKIASFTLRLGMKLLSPILKLVTSLFEIISLGIDTMSRGVEELGLMEMIDVFGNDILDKIGKPIDTICKFIDKLVAAFREGMGDEEHGGIAGGIEKVSKVLNDLLADHPVLLKVFNALGAVLSFIGSILSTVAMIVGGIFGGAITAVGGLIGLLVSGISSIVTWVTESELLAGIWDAIVSVFTSVGNAIKAVFDAAEEGYKNGGFMGALTSVLDTFAQGFSNLIPGGEAIVNLFGSIGTAIRTAFGRKNVEPSEATMEEMADAIQTVSGRTDDITNGILKLGEVADTIGPAIERTGEVVGTISDGMFGDEEQKKSFQEKVSQFIQTLWTGILNGLSQIRISDVIGAMRLSLIASLISSITGAITVFKDIGKAIKSIPETITEIGQQFAGMMKSLAATFTANAVLKFAVAAVLVGVALKIIEKIPKDTLTHAASVIIAVIGFMALLAKYLTKLNMSEFQKLSQLPNMAGLLFGLGVFVRSLALTFAIMAIVHALNPSAFWAAGAVIVILLGVVGAIAVGIINFSSDHSAEELRAVGKMMLSIGAAMVLLGIAIRKMAIPIAILAAVKHFLPNDFMDSVKAIGVIFLGMAVLVAILVSASEHFNEKELLSVGHLFLRIAAAMVVVAFSIQMLIIPIAALAAVDKYIGATALWDAVFAIGTIVAGLSILIGIYSGFLLKAGYSNMEQIGKTMLKIAASMLLAATAMRLMTGPIIRMAKLCEEVNNWDILTGVLMLLGTVAAIGMLLTTFNEKSGINGGGGLIKVAGAIALVALAMLLLSPAVIGLTLAVAVFAGVLAMLDDKTWKAFAKGLWRLVKIAGAVFVFGTALFVLGAGIVAAGVGLVTVAGGIFLLVAALAVLMLALPKFMDMLQDLKNTGFNEIWKSIKKVIFAVFGLVLLIGLLTIAFTVLSKWLSMETLEKLGSGLVGAAENIADGIKDGASSGFTKVIEFLKDKKNQEAILAALKALIVVGAAYVAGIIPTFTHVVIGGIVTLINAIATEVNAQSGPLVDAIISLLDAIAHLIMDLHAKLWGAENWEALGWLKKALLFVGLSLIALARIASVMNLAAPFKALSTLLTGGGAAASGGLIASLASLVPWLIGIVAAAAAIWFVVDRIKKYKDELAIEAEDRNEKFYGKKDPTIEERAEHLEEVAEAYSEVRAEEQKYKDEMAAAQKNQDQAAWDAANEAYIANAQRIATMESDYEVLFEQFAADLAAATGESKRDILKQLKDSGGDLSQVDAYQIYLESEAHAASVAAMETETYVTELQKMKSTLDSMGGSAEKIGMQASYNKKLQEYADALGITTAEMEALVTGQQATTETAAETTTATAAVAETATEAASAITEEAAATEVAVETMADSTDALGSILDKGKEILANHGVTDFNLSDYISTDKFDLQGLWDSLSSRFKDDPTGLFNTFAELSKVIPQGFGQGAEDNADLAFDGLDSMLGQMYAASEESPYLDSHSPSRAYAKLGKTIPEGVGAGIESKQSVPISKLGQLLNNMLKVFTTVRTNFITAGSDIAQAIATGISTNVDFSQSAGQNIAQGLINGVHASFMAVQSAGVRLADLINNSLKDELDMHSPSRVMIENGVNIVRGVSEGITREATASMWGTRDLSDSLTTALFNKVKKGLTVFTALNFAAKQRMKTTRKEIFEGLDDSVESYLTALERLAAKKDEVQDQIDITPDFRDDEVQRLERIDQIYDALIDVMLPELAAKLGLTSDAFYAQLEAANGNIYEMEAMRRYFGEYVSDIQSADLSQPIVDATTSASSMLAQATEPFARIDEIFSTFGADAAYGLIRGILENVYQAYTSGEDLAVALKTGFAEYLGIQSPSRVFASLASFIPAGITQGIQDKQGSAIESIVVLGDALIAAIMQSMAMVSTVASEDFDLQPHITPVVDLSDVNAAAGVVGSAFSGNYRVSAQMSNAINSRMGDVERLAAAMRSSQTVNQGDQITFNIYQQPGQNADELAEVVMQRMSTRFSRRGAAFG